MVMEEFGLFRYTTNGNLHISFFTSLFGVDFQFQPPREEIWPKGKILRPLLHGLWYNFIFLDKKCPLFEHIPGRSPKGKPIKAGVTKIARQANSVRITFNLMRFAICAHGHLNYLQGHFEAFNRISIWTESGWKSWISLITFTHLLSAPCFAFNRWDEDGVTASSGEIWW